MGVKIKTVRDDFPSMQKTVKQLQGKKVQVGCLQGEHAWLAAIHEYGCRIPVTDKMRAWFHYQGVHLKKETTEIVIPERSFLRAGYDKNRKDILERVQMLEQDVLDGTMSAEQFLTQTGLLMASAIKDYATELDSPANSGFTVERKGSSNPLWDTGQMIGGITYKVE